MASKPKKKSIVGTQTEKNVLTAFAGESCARNRYTFFASRAKKDGFVQIQEIFEETANQEKEHAKRLFKFLEGGEVTISIGLPAGKIGTTVENLEASASGEEHEWQEMYPEFADTAAAEGFEEIAAVMRNIAVAEKFHGQRFRKLADNIRSGQVFQRAAKTTVWRCKNCGFIYIGTTPPTECPACAHPTAYFELVKKNY